MRTPPPKDRISLLEEQIRSVCFHFKRENEEIKEKLIVLEQAVFNRSITPKEASKVLKISADMVRRHLEEGTIQGYKEGGRWKTTIEKLFEYMRSKPKKFGEGLSLFEVVKYFE